MDSYLVKSKCWKKTDYFCRGRNTFRIIGQPCGRNRPHSAESADVGVAECPWMQREPESSVSLMTTILGWKGMSSNPPVPFCQCVVVATVCLDLGHSSTRPFWKVEFKCVSSTSLAHFTQLPLQYSSEENADRCVSTLSNNCAYCGAGSSGPWGAGNERTRRNGLSALSDTWSRIHSREVFVITSEK